MLLLCGQISVAPDVYTEPDTPSDMSCYTPEPDARDRSSTLSPLPETQSPHSEMNPSFSLACTIPGNYSGPRESGLPEENLSW
jgi:hypothetical protein